MATPTCNIPSTYYGYYFCDIPNNSLLHIEGISYFPQHSQQNGELTDYCFSIINNNLLEQNDRSNQILIHDNEFEECKSKTNFRFQNITVLDSNDQPTHFCSTFPPEINSYRLILTKPPTTDSQNDLEFKHRFKRYGVPYQYTRKDVLKFFEKELRNLDVSQQTDMLDTAKKICTFCSKQITLTAYLAGIVTCVPCRRKFLYAFASIKDKTPIIQSVQLPPKRGITETEILVVDSDRYSSTTNAEVQQPAPLTKKMKMQNPPKESITQQEAEATKKSMALSRIIN